MLSSKKYSINDGTTKRFLSDFIIESEQHCRVYVYRYTPTCALTSTCNLLVDGVYNRELDAPQSSDLVTIDKFDLVDNSILFYVAPPAGTTTVIEVATTPEEFGSVVVLPIIQQAQNYATAAQLSATNAATSEVNAATSATTATTQAIAASASSTAAHTSELNAATSATDAAASALSATNSAAATAADVLTTNANALTSTTQAGIATTQATNSASSATAAATSATNASVSETTALSYLNDFKGRYYGALASDPILDPLGSAITSGDVYYNSTSNELRYYNGAIWIAWNISSIQFASLITNATAKTTPVDADLIGIVDSASSFSLKKLTWANIKTTLGLLFAPLASPSLTGNPTINGVNIGLYPYRNRIINGANNVNQINGTTAVTPTVAGYISDQWAYSCPQASKLTLQQVADAPAGFKYSTKITVASQYSPLATDSFILYQPIEGKNIIDFQLGTSGAVTLNTSNWIKGSVAGVYSVSIYNASGTRSYVGIINVTTSWAKVSITLVGDTTGTWATDNTAGLFWALDLGSGSNFNTTANTWQAGNFRRTVDSVTFVNQVVGSTLNITGVQLEKVPTGATQGTDYEWLPIEEEERRCHRYYEVLNTTTSTISRNGNGVNLYKTVFLPCKLKRVVPSSIGISSSSDATITTTPTKHGIEISTTNTGNYLYVTLAAGASLSAQL